METRVNLTSEALGQDESFEVSHAERLLAWPQSGWVLDDPQYEMKDGRIEVKSVPNTGKTLKARESDSPTGDETTPK